MSRTVIAPKRSSPVLDPPPLENGDRLGGREFLRRYEAMMEDETAELIQGVVHMASPVSAVHHSQPDGIVHGWLALYAADTPGVSFFPNATVILGPRNVPQPDSCLCVRPGRGGRARFNEKGYLVGAPELIAEIAASSASIDLGDKKEAYAASGVAEYLVWRVLDSAFDWLVLEDGDYQAMDPDAKGLLRSRVLPGLALDVKALLARRTSAVLRVQQRQFGTVAHRAFVASLR